MKPITRLQYANIVRKMRANKYGNNRIRIDGILFASQWEGACYQELKILERAGYITSLKHQVPYKLMAAGGEVVGKYIADFTYFESGQLVVADAKGFLTPLYKWKKRHMAAQYNCTIVEMKRNKGK